MTRIRFENTPSTNTPINAINLDKLNNVVISGEEPTTGEEVWIQKGKNLFNKDALYIPYTYDTKISTLDTGIRATAEKGVGNNRYAAIKLDKSLLGKTINLSATMEASSNNKPTLMMFFGTDEKPFLSNAEFGLGETGTVKVTLPNQFPDGCNGLYLLAYVNTSGTYEIGDYVDYTNLQISFEEGSYEPYIDKKIYTKNDNGDYEEFYNESRIGEIRITSTNENPSSYLGGVWELIDKDFIETTGSMNDAFIPNSDITTGHKLAFERNKDTIRIRLQLTLVAGLNDNDTHLGNIDFEKLGTIGFYYNIFNMPAFFDTGNTIFCVYVGGAGEIITKDILVRGGAASTPVTEGYIDFLIPIRSEAKLDSACDKFYWKRTA